MNKYEGSVNIFDNEGNSVYERTLSPDEIVETLLKGMIVNLADMVSEETTDEATPRKGTTKKTSKKKETKGKYACSICHVVGHTARKCTKPKNPVIEVVEEEPIMRARPLTFYEFGAVKKHQANHESVKWTAEELEAPEREVNLAYNFTDYDRYMESR